jgi:hypothetical protein
MCIALVGRVFALRKWLASLLSEHLHRAGLFPTFGRMLASTSYIL